MKRLHTVSAAVLGAGTLLGLVACSPAEQSGSAAAGHTTITFTSYNYGTQGAAGTGTQALLDRFAQLHPEITVKPQGVATADVLTKTKAAVAAGAAPDVCRSGTASSPKHSRPCPRSH
ncbi:extracellular solute-binding protein [Kribbella sp. NPDC049227]|uniref:extracellular solute-binding protein n=1 Tax=Kribbella sp. NPDC049227 TaxID=3364113 RepID=UPI0037155A7E